MSEADGRTDAFARVLPMGRGSHRVDTPRGLTDLDRVRELAPLLGASLKDEDYITAAVALYRRAAQHNIEVEHVRALCISDDTEADVVLTLLLGHDGELLGVLDSASKNGPQLLRPDTTWSPR